MEFPEFSLKRLLTTVFRPIGGGRTAILIDLDDPADIIDFKFLENDSYPIQRVAHDVFYRQLQDGLMDEIGLSGGELYAYRITGGSNLDLPDLAVAPDGRQISLEKDLYPQIDLVLCISTYSATAPLTAFAKQFGFRGATLHGVNEVILRSGLAVDYNEVSREAEKLRLGMTRADYFEIDFKMKDAVYTLRLITNQQEAQKSQGLCLGMEPDVANLPAGEVYFVPEGAEGEFPMKYEDGTLGLMKVSGGRIETASLVEGNEETVAAHNRLIQADPATGEIGELGFGTQQLPFSNADIQDEKIRGTVHIATGRSDHLGGSLTPNKFVEASNATHDDILFSAEKTPEILVTQVRMVRGDQQEVLIERFQPSAYMESLLVE